MKGIVQIGSKVVEFDAGDPVPRVTHLTMRKCPKSPVKRYELSLLTVDHSLKLAVYRVEREY